MRELDYQSLIVKTVREHFGVAFKLANKFLVGVPDLFIHMEGITGAWEVKRGVEPMPPKEAVQDRVLTAKQYEFLKNYAESGGLGGVIQFLEARRHVSVGVFDFDRYKKGWIFVRHFTLLERGRREELIYSKLKVIYDRHKSTIGQPRPQPRGFHGHGANSDGDQVSMAQSGGVERSEPVSEGMPGHDSDESWEDTCRRSKF